MPMFLLHQLVLFPAHAGVIRVNGEAKAADLTIPRTRGGDPPAKLLQPNHQFYSPHTRG